MCQTLTMAREPKEPLTPREENVLALLRRGLTNAQLAGELGISENTAKDHVSSILHKLRTKSRHEAAYWSDQAPWWARAPLIAPLALLLRRSLPISPATVATGLARRGVSCCGRRRGPDRVPYLSRGRRSDNRASNRHAHLTDGA